MGNYNKEDKRAFYLKDVLMAKCAALKAASVLHEGHETQPAKVLKESEKYYSWLFQEREPVIAEEPQDENKPEFSVLPPPNPEQSKVIEQIMQLVQNDADAGYVVDRRKLEKEIYNVVSPKLTGKEGYPSLPASAANVLRELDRDAVLVENNFPE